MSVDQVPEIKQACSTLRRMAFQYGLPTAYKQEQDGRLIQHIFPVQRTESAQISSSSKIDLQLHTESAFHPYSPSFVILMCVREDLNAATTFALVDDIVKSLDEETVFYLKEPLFVTAIDESFRTHGEPNKNILLSILTETPNGLSICFDEYFMRGKTFQAQEALDKLLEAIKENTKEIILRTGDVLILDNSKLVHGRKSFTARYDGTDRWLLRMLVVDKMPPENQYIYDDHMVIVTEM
jgi:hypothetical protein